jgi:hypothetical protein
VFSKAIDLRANSAEDTEFSGSVFDELLWKQAPEARASMIKGNISGCCHFEAVLLTAEQSDAVKAFQGLDVFQHDFAKWMVSKGHAQDAAIKAVRGLKQWDLVKLRQEMEAK